jgi:hypothetical protein
MTTNRRSLAIWLAAALAFGALATSGVAHAHAYARGGSTAYRIGAGVSNHLNIDLADADDDIATSGGVVDFFVGEIVSPDFATGLGLRLELTFPVEDLKIGGEELRDVGVFDAVASWQSDFMVQRPVWLRLGGGVAMARVLESSEAVDPRMSYGIAGMLAVPVSLKAVGDSGWHTCLVPGFTLLRTLSDSAALGALTSAAFTLTIELSYDPKLEDAAEPPDKGIPLEPASLARLKAQ